MTPPTQTSNSVFKNIRDILENAKSRVYQSFNFIMVEAYWNIERIIEDIDIHYKYAKEFITQKVKN